MRVSTRSELHGTEYLNAHEDPGSWWLYVRMCYMASHALFWSMQFTPGGHTSFYFTTPRNRHMIIFKMHCFVTSEHTKE